MTDRYAVIGNPISHSKSPAIHAAFAAATGQDMRYDAMLGPLDGFAATVRAFRDSGGCGMNVTIPFKLQALELADETSERARGAGAVNALKFEGGRILADNADGLGLISDIRRNLGVAFKGKRVLVCGAGGAARGAMLPLLAEAPATLVVANRTVAKAEALATIFGAIGPVQACGYADLGDAWFDIVINTTSATLSGERLPLNDSVFRADGLAYEMMYGKGLTPFLGQARAAGTARIADGLGMLIEQAAEAFEWWRGVRPDTSVLITSMAQPLI